jgi:hypothetical protein
MRQVLADYFAAEKLERWFFLGVGLAASAASAWLWSTGSGFKGMGIPLVLVGLIQVVVGASVGFRTDAQVAGLTAQLERDPAGLAAAERPRMEKVMANFTLYKVVELAVLLGGVALTVLLRRSELAYFAGVGCVLQGSLMLVLDLFAEHRGAAYLQALGGLGG